MRKSTAVHVGAVNFMVPSEFRVCRWFHMTIAPRLMTRTVEAAIQRGEDWREFFVNVTSDATWEDYRAALLNRDKPLLIGDCDNVQPDGTCGGHDEHDKGEGSAKR